MLGAAAGCDITTAAPSAWHSPRSSKLLTFKIPSGSWAFDPLERHNFWNVFFGQLFMWTSLLGVNQPAVQRLLSLPSYRQAAL